MSTDKIQFRFPCLHCKRVVNARREGDGFVLVQHNVSEYGHGRRCVTRGVITLDEMRAWTREQRDAAAGWGDAERARAQKDHETRLAKIAACEVERAAEAAALDRLLAKM